MEINIYKISGFSKVTSEPKNTTRITCTAEYCYTQCLLEVYRELKLYTIPFSLPLPVLLLPVVIKC